MASDNHIVNIHAYPSFFTNESRILREARAVVDTRLVDNVYLVGFWKPGLLKRESIAPSIEIIRFTCGFGKVNHWKWLNIISFTIFYIKCFWFSIQHRPTVINAHALTVLPLCTFIKFFTKAKLIYDAHELETETNDSTGVRKIMAKGIERLFIGAVDFTIVVSPSIKSWYEKKYKLSNIEVVRSIPDTDATKRELNSVRTRLNIPEDDLVFIYVGTLIKGRGIEMILHAFKTTRKNNHIVFMGYGTLEEKIMNENGSNIHFLKAVPPEQVVDITRSADLGISYIENTCLSYYYCLPNKVFEYLSAEIPFICSDLPDLRNEFEPYHVSWFVDSGERLVTLINSITKEEVVQKKRNISLHKSRWTWDSEKQVIHAIYMKLLRPIENK